MENEEWRIERPCDSSAASLPEKPFPLPLFLFSLSCSLRFLWYEGFGLSLRRAYRYRCQGLPAENTGLGGHQPGSGRHNTPSPPEELRIDK